MSEIINEAIIKVTADATGVEEGGRKIDAVAARTGKSLENLGATAQKTGKSLDNLGDSAGLRSVGEGRSAAAGKVDLATKRMAESIQRATATMGIGSKSSAAYYESLANTRGLNVAALRPYLDQLDAVTKKTAQAAAAQRQLYAGNNFLVGLRAQADGIDKTASQLGPPCALKNWVWLMPLGRSSSNCRLRKRLRATLAHPSAAWEQLSRCDCRRDCAARR